MKNVVLALVILAGSSPAAAQRYLSVQTNPTAVVVVDVNAGALYDFELIDLAATAAPPITGQPWDAALVDDEIWVSAGRTIYRYDAVSLSLISAIAIPVPAAAYGIEPFAGGAWLAAGSELRQYDTNGNLLATHAVMNAHDVLQYAGELLVSNQVDDTVDRYDLNGQPLGVFADASAVTTAFLPGQLAVASNGNVLVAGAIRIFELDPSGALLNEFQAGPFEQGVQELPDGRLLVNLAVGAAVFDSTTSLPTTISATASHNMRFLSPFDSGDGTSTRYCVGAPNSVGSGARIAAFGTRLVAPGQLQLSASALPPQAFSLFIYGANSTQTPFGDGFLCVSPFAPGLVRLFPGQSSDAVGDVLITVDYATQPALGVITAGSTWSFQLIYRDSGFGAAGFNATDGIRITFAP